ncbi:uncharacterized protein Z519_10790 [Cladophialophora bantiana CBS 173.52]|uniref:FAD-binding PCMH-type domain-containing protein n=1 Tax=Cladophialophora bantiana (strain ATCC 10958 / CBS 173.52 / CDC B-1940 / NIH 8579) TaxID=1442370 RepID=A0A0D2H5Y5_CLAB1|nr:uncharacterized protein Z519_10790 [Cladophialophora bantiana CBS 173.52]KIW88743.1 hypothetical protein Z519_10790 [Cladophialophora bantiana CBS 173.52]
MTGLDTVSINDNHSVVSVGAGSSWLAVYAYLDRLNLAITGGRNVAVGVGGLTLGGGISHFTARVGWASDNVVNFQVALAAGALVDGDISVTTLSRAIEEQDKVFDAFTDLTAATPFDPYISLVMGLLFNATTKAWTLSNWAVYAAAGPDLAAFRQLRAIPSLSNTTGIITNLSTFANESLMPPL